MAVIQGEDMKLQWLIVDAFRYAVGRHGTHAILDIEEVLFDNIDIMDDGFIAQFIRDIKNEMDTARFLSSVTDGYKKDFFKRLNGHVDDYIRYLKDEPDAKELYNHLVAVRSLTDKTKLKKTDTYSPKWFCDASYLKPMYERLQEEYVKRGYKRIE